MKRAWMMTVVLIATALSLTPAGTQQKPEGLVQMEKLGLLVGTWTYTETYAKGASGTGTYTAQQGPGGYSLIVDFTTHMSGHDESGHGMITWDPKEKTYKEYMVGNSYPGCAVFTGSWEGTVLNFYGEFDTPRGKITLKNSYTEWKPGSITIEGYSRVGDGPFQLLYTTKATKP